MFLHVLIVKNIPKGTHSSRRFLTLEDFKFWISYLYIFPFAVIDHFLVLIKGSSSFQQFLIKNTFTLAECLSVTNLINSSIFCPASTVLVLSLSVLSTMTVHPLPTIIPNLEQKGAFSSGHNHKLHRGRQKSNVKNIGNRLKFNFNAYSWSIF